MICQCDHESHFTGSGHDYLAPNVVAGAQSAISVGPICDDCAHAHMAHQLDEPLPGLDMKGQLQ